MDSSEQGKLLKIGLHFNPYGAVHLSTATCANLAPKFKSPCGFSETGEEVQLHKVKITQTYSRERCSRS
jgi:hypothetical protein